MFTVFSIGIIFRVFIRIRPAIDKKCAMLRVAILLLFSCALFPVTAFSQDILIKQDGEEIRGFVHKIGMDKITYRTSTNGPLNSILRSKVFMIKKRNGEEIYLYEEQSQHPAPEGDTQYKPEDEEQPQHPTAEDDIHHNSSEEEPSQTPVIVDEIYYNPDEEEQPQPSVPAADNYYNPDEKEQSQPPTSGDNIHDSLDDEQSESPTPEDDIPYSSAKDEGGRGSYSPPPSNSGNKQAQNYKFAAGFRLGYPSAATIKLFVSENHALEVYAGARGFAFTGSRSVSGAYQVHSNPINGLGGLKWYTGVGVTVFLDDSPLDNIAPSFYGLQSYAGLEYVFEDIPLSISVDWIPTYLLNDEWSNIGFSGDYGTLAVRYIISK